MNQALRQLQYKIERGRLKDRVFGRTDFNDMAWQVQHLENQVRTVEEQMLCRRLHTLAVQKSDALLASERAAKEAGLKPGYYFTKNHHIIRINRLVPVGEYIECCLTDFPLVRVTYDSDGKVVGGSYCNALDLQLESREDLEIFAAASLLHQTS